ncbi:hypothetical protein IEC97_15385 [Neobacillus cucumis]|uniref:hypothetical protein n=1 Tax=Neobacillus cucumis TaxID=1740721 RepID=UPI0018DF29EC|nr:hypothetical protein [Neobacillus cucumis]MBI0578746.1 hypothetical protein [Neobacillus cucumis]WHY92545.1 hypothetical protein QNK12_03270 [Neobacillus cucumis]
MPSENKNSPNNIKYSIWETRTDEEQMENKHKITEAIQGTNLESKIEEKHE